MWFSFVTLTGSPGWLQSHCIVKDYCLVTAGRTGVSQHIRFMQCQGLKPELHMCEAREVSTESHLQSNFKKNNIEIVPYPKLWCFPGFKIWQYSTLETLGNSSQSPQYHEYRLGSLPWTPTIVSPGQLAPNAFQHGVFSAYVFGGIING